jgi:gamma-glutamyl hercynylcysteine S-oxide synthase
LIFRSNPSDKAGYPHAKSRFSTVNYPPTEILRDSVNETVGDRRQTLKAWMQSCRQATLDQIEAIDYDTLCRQVHPDFSPVGWHVGHIAFTESLWILEHLAGQPPHPHYRRLFAQDGLPKSERCKLPTLPELHHYLATIRTQVFAYLETAPLATQERLWRWLLQHESQHSETIALILQLQQWKLGSREWGVRKPQSPRRTVNHDSNQPQNAVCCDRDDMIEIPAGYFEQGNNALDAIDNECMVHPVFLETYWIDRYPVTCAQYRLFIESGGYQNANWWSEAGWDWLQRNPVAKPLYWSDDPEWDDHPVCGVSWYEAEAYANFVGKRLPTESEWEKAASWNPITQQRQTYTWGEALPTSRHCNHDHWIGHTTPVSDYAAGCSAYGCVDMLGNVWEWTADWFNSYPGFSPFPYPGYSKLYFDGKHKVMRGGSWATRPWSLRCPFRNWYHPHVRQVLVGFRCARSK